uniref:Uncharacterized protein n=1 Tax=Populus trichocarpa TaxID=3694 RepID=A0A3N7HZ35_POPTR
MRNTATKLVHVDNSKDFFSCTSYSSCTGRGTAASRTSNKRSTFSILHHEQTQLEQNSLLSRSLQQPSTIQSSILLCVSKTQQKPVERGRTKRQRTREDEEESKTRRRERPIRQCTSAVGFVSRYSKYPHDMASNSRGNDALNVANVKLIGSMPSSLLERSDQRLVSLRFGTRMMTSFSALEL